MYCSWSFKLILHFCNMSANFNLFRLKFLQKVFILNTPFISFITQDEDEWKEVKEDQGKDYTGLKIGQLTINEEDSLQNKLLHDQDDSTDTDSHAAGSKGHDPWKKSGGAPTSSQQSKNVTLETPVGHQIYISPSVKVNVNLFFFIRFLENGFLSCSCYFL